jgi:hypothetical protein
MNQFLHEIVHSEIRFGYIYIRITDGTLDFFESLSERFDVDLRGEMLYNRTISANKLWLGYSQTCKFRPGEIIKLTKKKDVVTIKKYNKI